MPDGSSNSIFFDVEMPKEIPMVNIADPRESRRVQPGSCKMRRREGRGGYWLVARIDGEEFGLLEVIMKDLERLGRVKITRVH